MANAAHVELVRRGPAAVAERPAKWAVLDLSGADLRRIDLRGACLEKANLSRSNLKNANLTDSNLRGANLCGAKLPGADLTGADLSGANLSDATFQGAQLTDAMMVDAILDRAIFGEADLQAAILAGAIAKDTNFFGAAFGSTVFGGIDLSSALNLDETEHWAPSSIGIDSLFKFRGKAPEKFLRGCGVPEDLITYLPSLQGRGIEFYSSFISYSSKDEAFAKRLHMRMQQEGLRVWFAPEDMRGGKKSHEQIFDAIRVFDKLLIVLSANSMNSEWVRTEIRRARQREREQGIQVLFPIRLVGIDAIREWECFDADRGKDMAVEIREYHIPDFSKWKNHDAFESEFNRLLRDLKQPRQIKVN